MGWAPACAGLAVLRYAPAALLRMSGGFNVKKISAKREDVYLRTLAETGNATLAAERAGVSRSWAYARRKVDPRFDAWFGEMMVRFRETPPTTPPLPAQPLAESPSPSAGGGKKRTRVNRDRADGWTA